MSPSACTNRILPAGISLLSRDANGLSHSVPPLGFARYEPPEFFGGRALYNYASRNKVLSHFLIGNDFTSNAICPIDPILAKVCRCASQQISPGDVRFGSKADIEALPSDVRFTPKSGH